MVKADERSIVIPVWRQVLYAAATVVLFFAIVEAVNAAGMSYGSHRLRVLAHEVLSYRPDAVVFYEGHHEFIERRFQDRLNAGAGELGALRHLIYRSRLGSLMTRTIEKVRGGAGAGRWWLRRRRNCRKL